MIAALNIIGGIASFVAAAFWFLASRPLPQMRTYVGFTPPDDPYAKAISNSAKMNRFAAMLTGVAAISLGLSVAAQAFGGSQSPEGVATRSLADSVGISSLHIAQAALIVSVLTLVAVGAQIWLARRTLDVTNQELSLTQDTLTAAKDELKLTEQALQASTQQLSLAQEQLVEAKKSSEQTRLALEYTKEQITLARRDAVDRVKQIAPQVVAEVRLDEGRQLYFVWIMNKGGVARYVGLSGRDPNHQEYSRAGNTLQMLGSGEMHRSGIYWAVAPGLQYARKIRLRYYDSYGNKYMTEYESLSNTLSYPIYREPWLGREYDFPRPLKCSDRVSWPVEHFERLMPERGEEPEGDEPVDETTETQAENLDVRIGDEEVDSL